MYPLNLTPRKNVWRLLPNHFLDLRQWEAVRHWPKAEILPVGDTDQAVTQVVERVRLHMKALVAKKPVLLRLTAGQDSRVLLACARPLAQHMTFFTAEHEFLDAESWHILPVISSFVTSVFRISARDKPTLMNGCCGQDGASGRYVDGARLLPINNCLLVTLTSSGSLGELRAVCPGDRMTLNEPR